PNRQRRKSVESRFGRGLSIGNTSRFVLGRYHRAGNQRSRCISHCTCNSRSCRLSQHNTADKRDGNNNGCELSNHGNHVCTPFCVVVLLRRVSQTSTRTDLPIDRVTRPSLVRAIGRWSLTAGVINAVIGSGIFGLPSAVASLVGAWSPVAVLI